MQQNCSSMTDMRYVILKCVFLAEKMYVSLLVCVSVFPDDGNEGHRYVEPWL